MAYRSSTLGWVAVSAVLAALVLLGFAARQANCDLFGEDFGGFDHEWSAAFGQWYVADGRLNVDTIEPDAMARYATAYSAAGPFTADVAVEVVSATHVNAAFGMFLYNSADTFLEVDGRTVSGVGAIAYPNLGTVRLLAWDVDAQAWYQSEPVPLPPGLTAIGVTYSDAAITLRLDRQDTALRFTGDFTSAPLLLDTLWLLAQESGTHVRFDDVCADALNGGVPPVTQHLLTVTPIGSGSGTVTSTPPGIECGSDCTHSFDAGMEVSLQASPEADANFIGWSGGGCSGVGSCTVAMDADVAVSAEFAGLPPPGTAMLPMPQGQQSFTYGAVAAAAISSDPADTKPAGVGAAADGGDSFGVEVALAEFESGVDIYVGFYLPALDPVNLYLLQADGTFTTLARSGLVPWMENVQAEVRRTIMGPGIAMSVLPTGAYYVYVLAAPHGSLSAFYLWGTYFSRLPTWLAQPPDPDQYDWVIEFEGRPPAPLPPPPPTLDADLIVPPTAARDAVSTKTTGAELEIVDAALEFTPQPGADSCASHLRRPTVTLRNRGTAPNGPDDVWMVKYSFLELSDGGMWSPALPQTREKVGGVKAGRLYGKPPFVITPGTTSTWEAVDTVYSNLFPRTIRWDLWRASSEFEGKWELRQILVRTFHVAGPNLSFLKGNIHGSNDPDAVGNRAFASVHVQNNGDTGTETPVHVRVVIPIVDLDQQHNSAPSESFNQAYSWQFTFPPIAAGHSATSDRGQVDYAYDLEPDWSKILVSVWRQCGDYAQFAQGWDQDVRDNYVKSPKQLIPVQR